MNTALILHEEWLDAANKFRSKAGSPPLEWDSRLEQCATSHRDELAKRRKMDHMGLDGSSPWDRIKRSGFPVNDMDPMSSGSEGLGLGYTDPTQLFDGFASETNYVYKPNVRSHATDLLNPRYNRIGCAGPSDSFAIWVVDYGYDSEPIKLTDKDFELWATPGHKGIK